jgi:hypothetical protein
MRLTHCDRCGATPADNVVASMAVGAALDSHKVARRFDFDLCQPCTDRLSEKVQAAFTTAMAKE